MLSLYVYDMFPVRSFFVLFYGEDDPVSTVRVDLSYLYLKMMIVFGIQ